MTRAVIDGGLAVDFAPTQVRNSSHVQAGWMLLTIGLSPVT
jgi:hypothetical protein